MFIDFLMPQSVKPEYETGKFTVTLFCNKFAYLLTCLFRSLGHVLSKQQIYLTETLAKLKIHVILRFSGQSILKGEIVLSHYDKFLKGLSCCFLHHAAQTS